MSWLCKNKEFDSKYQARLEDTNEHNQHSSWGLLAALHLEDVEVAYIWMDDHPFCNQIIVWYSNIRLLRPLSSAFVSLILLHASSREVMQLPSTLSWILAQFDCYSVVPPPNSHRCTYVKLLINIDQTNIYLFFTKLILRKEINLLRVKRRERHEEELCFGSVYIEFQPIWPCVQTHFIAANPRIYSFVHCIGAIEWSPSSHIVQFLDENESEKLLIRWTLFFENYCCAHELLQFK